MTLIELKKGNRAIVVAVHHPVPMIRQKYLARGIVPGAELSVVRHGNPLVVALEHTRWAIAHEEARDIEVTSPAELADRRSWWQRALSR